MLSFHQKFFEKICLYDPFDTLYSPKIDQRMVGLSELDMIKYVDKSSTDISIFVSHYGEGVRGFDPTTTVWFLTKPVQVEQLVYSNNFECICRKGPPSSCRYL